MSYNKKQKIAEYKKRYGDEQVFVVPYTEFSDIENGFTKAEHTNAIWSKYDNLGRYIYRYDAESEPALQQLIPHIIIQHPITNKYYVSTRLPKSGEQRLVDKMAMGYGGHINICDSYGDNILFEALSRELQEELVIDPYAAASAKFIGYVRKFTNDINKDGEIDVSSVHIGLVFLIKTDDVAIKETDKLSGQWMDIKELEENYFKFEAWGKYIIDYLVVDKNKF